MLSAVLSASFSQLITPHSPTMNERHHYFAYGSNLHPTRLQERIGVCEARGVAVLSEARLTFAKRGIDGSGKCHLDFTGDTKHQVLGVLYLVSREQREALDHWEATTCGYESICPAVTYQGTSVEVFTYKARTELVDQTLVPVHWYKRLVILGAVYFEFPQDYLQKLHAVPAVAETDPHLEARHATLISELEQVNIRSKHATRREIP
jgi:gamma-glutamylcyclotransferase